MQGWLEISDVGQFCCAIEKILSIQSVCFEYCFDLIHENIEHPFLNNDIFVR